MAKRSPLQEALDELDRRKAEYIEKHGHEPKYIFTGDPSIGFNYTADPAHPGDASQWVG